MCYPEDLLVDLPPGTSGIWSPLTSGQPGYSFNGGNVTFDGISEGSTATYTTHGDYFVSGGQFFQTVCQKNEWTHLPTIYITGLLTVFIISIRSAFDSADYSCSSSSSDSKSTAAIIGVVCSVVFLSVGVLLGAVSVYLLLRPRGKLSLPPSSSPPPLLPAATYEEVDVSRKVTSTQKIQLSTNEAYSFRETISTSLNTAYEL